MPQKILKSSIRAPDRYAAGVMAYVEELNAHVAHMKMVAELDDPTKAQAYPAPQAPEEIVLALVRDEQTGLYRADYEIVDDGPTPAQILRAKKDELLARVTAMEAEASAAVLPPGKRRLSSLRYDRAMVKYWANRPPDANAVDLRAPKRAKVPLTSDEQNHIEDHDLAVYELDAITLHAAELHAQIEDLDESNIDTWAPSPFPEPGAA